MPGSHGRFEECGTVNALPLPAHWQGERQHLRLDPHDPRFFENPYPFYAALHALGGIFFWEDFGLWCVGNSEGVNRLLRDRRLGRERPGGYRAWAEAQGNRAHLADFDAIESHSMLELEPPAHTRLRGLVNRAFVSRQVERLRPDIEALAHELVDGFAGEPEADLIARYAARLPATVITRMMGLPDAEAGRLVAWSNTMVRLYMHGATSADAARANAAARAFAAYVAERVAGRRGTDDLLGVLVSAAEDGDRLSNEELVSTTILLLNAGHEATVHQIGNAVAAILDQGGDPRRFFASPAATEATVEECLRFDAPLHMFTRFAYEPVEIAPGIVIKHGEQVALLLGMANRDPLAHARPDRFEPGRTRGSVSFGAGIHFCVGAPLARLELEIALAVLFERFPGLRLSRSPKRRDTYHFRGLERLVCRWQDQ